MAGYSGAVALLEQSEQWDLSGVTRQGGCLIFPHATLSVCGHHIGAVVRALLDSGAGTVFVLGVVHALTPEIRAAREAAATHRSLEYVPLRGLFGEGFAQTSADVLRAEFSLSHFEFLWSAELRRRGIPDSRAPRLILCYPHLVLGQPDTIPGIEALTKLAATDCSVACTMDPMHHGTGYGDSQKNAMAIGASAETAAYAGILQGLNLLCKKDYSGYIAHCDKSRSDGRDTGQIAAHLTDPKTARVLDVVLDDMTGPYQCPAPAWVAGALCTLQVQPDKQLAGERV